MKRRPRLAVSRPGLLVGFVIALATIYPAVAIGGSTASSSRAAASVAPIGGTVTADAAQSLTPATAPNIPTPAKPNVFTDRPSMPLADYQAAKAAANALPKGSRSGGGLAAAHANSVTSLLGALSTNTLLGSFNATGECGTTVNDGCWIPPDVNGSVGTTQQVEIVNNHIDVYSKSTTPSTLMELTTNSFFGFGQSLTDPRVEFDRLWHRWVAIEQTGTGNLIGLAISIDSDLTHGWFVYHFGLPAFGSIDYPQLALTQDAIVITYSDFFGGGEDAWTFGVAKAIAYNAFGFSTPVFIVGSNSTATPSNVIDANPREHELLYTPGVGVSNITFQDPQAFFFGSITSVVAIAGLTAVVPPDATQPLTGPCPAPSCLLDTLDGRFQNDQTQYGDDLWAIHTQIASGLPTPFWSDIDTEGGGANTVKQSGQVFARPTSNDWNPSIAAQADGRAYFNWSWDNSTGDISNPLNAKPSMAVSGRLGTDAPGTRNPATNVFTSPSVLTGNYDPFHGKQRWGDTSSIRFDPSAFTTAWAFNETVQSGGNLWGTRGAAMQIN